jgi:glycosyl transferase family 25
MKTKDLSQLLIDGILCISLKSRQDRRDLILKEFKDCGLSIEFVLVAPHETNPEQGCFESHIKCAQIALERNYRNVLILEDDATLNNFHSKKIPQINKFLLHKKPEIFYLGATLGKLWLTWNRGIARYRTKGAFAYIISNDGCKKLLEFTPFAGLAIDQIISKNFKAYGAFPLICQHQPESMATSNISPYRYRNEKLQPQHYGSDEKFWRSNWRRQFYQAFKNSGKTLIRKDL